MLIILIKENKFISLVNRNMTIRLVPKTPDKQEHKNTVFINTSITYGINRTILIL